MTPKLHELAAESHRVVDDSSAGFAALVSEQAAAIAATLKKEAIQGSVGQVAWITHPSAVSAGPGASGRLRYDLQSGILGVALFLAALDRALGVTEHRDLVFRSIQPLRALSADYLDAWVARDGIGAGSGLPSIVYALMRIANFLDDEAVFRLAIRFARCINRRHVAAAEKLDLVGGSAGCLLVWTALFQQISESWVIERAIDCGESLLQRRSSTPSGLLGWEIFPGKWLTGLAHGTAGIAYALSRLFEATGDGRFRNAACEAVAYEDSLFSVEEGNWPHLLSPNSTGGFTCWNSWCNGAPGIGLARLGSLACLDRDTSTRDIDRALRAAAKSGPLAHLDFPCCGTLGRGELFLQAGRKLGICSYRQQATELAAGVIRRAHKRGAYGLGNGHPSQRLSFHQGIAGIGYQLLRSACPELLPSVLCWE